MPVYGSCLLLAGALIAPPAAEILRLADEALFPDSTVMQMVLTDHRPKNKERSFRIEVKAARKTGGVLSFLSPATETGKKYLFRDRNIWISIPGMPNAIRVSAKEAFMDSTFANNDLMDTEYSDDYDVSLEGASENQGRPVYVLSCSARTPQVAYNRLRMQIDRETFIPVEFEYFTRSGLLLKTCLFSDRRPMAGRLRATRIEMQDASVANTYSVITIEKMAAVALPPGTFSLEGARR